MRYPIVIEPGSDATAFGVVFPDLPGCFSAGDTLDEAIKNASEAAALWIEDALDNGNHVPAPSSFDAVRNNPEWKGWIFALADVDPMLFDTSAERVNITLPRRVLVRLDRRAKEEGETRSGFIARMAMSA
jgi:predicted RNase H-like HicB family nuclease